MVYDELSFKGKSQKMHLWFKEITEEKSFRNKFRLGEVWSIQITSQRKATWRIMNSCMQTSLLFGTDRHTIFSYNIWFMISLQLGYNWSTNDDDIRQLGILRLNHNRRTAAIIFFFSVAFVPDQTVPPKSIFWVAHPPTLSNVQNTNTVPCHPNCNFCVVLDYSIHIELIGLFSLVSIDFSLPTLNGRQPSSLTTATDLARSDNWSQWTGSLNWINWKAGAKSLFSTSAISQSGKWQSLTQWWDCSVGGHCSAQYCVTSQCDITATASRIYNLAATKKRRKFNTLVRSSYGGLLVIFAVLSPPPDGSLQAEGKDMSRSDKRSWREVRMMGEELWR